MAVMYCALCNRAVEAHRQIGVGTVVVAVLTAGFSLLAVPFYRKRCSICHGTALAHGVAPSLPGATGALPSDLERRLSRAESDLEDANTELDQLRTERDFYRQLLEDPAARKKYRPGEPM